ncbi:hypothetical protein L249_3074 [Ophiocordyceps polyrhachis-furcata BCC 54312]|uniref:GED domain-containing protein n=1 Tax=Ophiocordyceps polyrhachis-furcata BCC 54312 TaxID=1330021 RepID=A0A367LRA7_9HYPO|nr:hypothetical protein L249_3074 [Ophiocordyceps polyrhachis-furcata BCC 54312]
MSRAAAKRAAAVVKAEPNRALQNSSTAPPARASNSPDGSVAATVDFVGSTTARYGRSDAPTPSEHLTAEPDLLFREIRPVIRAQPSLAMGSPAKAEESFLQSSFRDIGKHLKNCNDTLGELQQLGVSHEVQLPELVLVGDQSAGKSSLMSGLAHLNLPRSEGTCTRCPLHIRVSKNSEWSCRVWLRKNYFYDPPRDRDVVESDITDKDPFFPWKLRRATVVQEFKTMHDSDEIEEVLRWAQIAILNDDTHYASFVPKLGTTARTIPVEQAAETTAAKFSPNVVALEIKGPGLPDLSFYDMPGIFENPADAKDDYLVNVVQNLTKSYMSHPSAIIICAMPMNSDAENSSSFRLTRKLAATNRTIGVLTKADLLPEGNHDQWLNIMKGEAHVTGLGYFITSRPPNKDLEDLIKWESNVFEQGSNANWPDSFHRFTSRSGVEKLIAFLSEKLGEEFQKRQVCSSSPYKHQVRLPMIRDKVTDHLKKINKQLKSLPDLPENVPLEIQTGLHKFSERSAAKTDEFIKHFNQLPQNFLACLLKIKPKFVLKDRWDSPVVEISDDDSEIGVAGRLATPKRVTSCSNTPSKRQKMANGNGYVKAEDEALPIAMPMTPRTRREEALPEPFSEFRNIGRGFRTLREVHDDIRMKTNAGMPERHSDDVYINLIQGAIEPWKLPMEAFLKETMRTLQERLDEALNAALANLKKRSVYKETQKRVRECLREHRQEAHSALVQLYEDEKARFLTFNEDALGRYKREEHEALVEFRTRMRVEARIVRRQEMDDAAWKKKFDAEAAKLGPDKFARELKVIAYVRGYYRLAAYRFADAVAQRIMCRMIPSIRLKLYCVDEMLGLRGPNANQIYMALVEEDANTAANREAYKSEKIKFEKALESIRRLDARRAGAGSSAVDFEESTQAVTGGENGAMEGVGEDDAVDISMDEA